VALARLACDLVGSLRRVPWFSVPLAIFAVTRLIDAVVIVLLARHQIPPSSLPSDVPIPTVVDPPSYLSAIQSWDGQWYRQIVEHGYPRTLPTQDGEVQQNAWAFYPGYPAVVWLVTRLGASFGVAASIVSLSAGAAAMCVLYRTVLARSGEWLAGMSVLALCCAPAAPIFQAAYTESLALLLLMVALWCLDRRHYGWLVVVGLALALTRPVTAPLALAAGVVLVQRWRRRGHEEFPVRERWALAGAAAALALSTAVWPLVTGLVVGDASAYAETQRAWRGVAGSRPDTWLQSLLHSAPLGRWVFVAVVIAATVAIALRTTRWGTGIRAWTATYPAFILAATPATSSVFRYLLLVGPAWWPFSPHGAPTPSVARRVVLVGTVAVVGLASQALWLYWYFVITPGSRGTP
jgi:hypothetical protein